MTPDATERQGLITKSLDGFYWVKSGEEELVCRGRGLFRRDDVVLLVGDRVTARPTGPGEGSIVSLLPRVNSLVRPPVANIGRLALIVSCADPVPNLYVLDKLTAIAARRGIPVLLVFTKCDLADPAPFAGIYRRAGYPVRCVSSATGEGRQDVKDALSGGVTVFCGNSGVGKSSLLNLLYPGLRQEVGETSKKLGRGRHTTRCVQLFPDGAGGYVADTPGFSSVDFLQYERMTAAGLQDCFPEFAPYRDRCQFTGCSHRTEKGCAVLAAVEAGAIPPSRHESYRMLYEELKDVKEWELKDDE